tara:strand:+ start:96553 stop:96750 length:198 start_codon:yes stop_codon:yes gene_type:complete
VLNKLQSLSQIEVAEENLRSTKLNLSYTRVHASVDGYISNINFQIGDPARVTLMAYPDQSMQGTV